MNRGLTDVIDCSSPHMWISQHSKSLLKIYRFCNSIIIAPHPGLRTEHVIVTREWVMNRKWKTEDNTKRQSNLMFICFCVGLKISSVFKHFILDSPKWDLILTQASKCNSAFKPSSHSTWDKETWYKAERMMALKAFIKSVTSSGYALCFLWDTSAN